MKKKTAESARIFYATYENVRWLGKKNRPYLLVSHLHCASDKRNAWNLWALRVTLANTQK